jgi:hypothetical protein
MHPDSSTIAELTGCTPEQAQAALEALITKGWAPPSDITEPAANSATVEPARRQSYATSQVTQGRPTTRGLTAGQAGCGEPAVAAP